MDALVIKVTHWRLPQDGLQNVVRWKRLGGELKQTVLQHVVGIQLLATTIIPYIEETYPINKGLVLHGLLVHDNGEIKTGDTPAPDKRNEHDVHEYEVFCEQVAELPFLIQASQKEAFLLQFAAKPDEERAEFSQEAQRIMDNLRIEYPNEVLLFRFLEILDYLMHAFAGHFLADCQIVINDILENYIPEMRDYVEEIPALANVWTPEIDAWAVAYVESIKS